MRLWIYLNSAGVLVVLMSVYFDTGIVLVTCYSILVLIFVISLCLGVIQVLRREHRLGFRIIALSLLTGMLEYLFFMYKIILMSASVGNW